MARIAGVNIPDNKKIIISLSYIYGIGYPLAVKIVHLAKVDPNKRANQLSTEELNRLRDIVEKNYKIEGDLRRQVQMNVRRLIEISAWRGGRHTRNLPIHGRTKTNSRTRRGNARKTVGSGRKKSAEKT